MGKGHRFEQWENNPEKVADVLPTINTAPCPVRGGMPLVKIDVEQDAHRRLEHRIRWLCKIHGFIEMRWSIPKMNFFAKGQVQKDCKQVFILPTRL